VGRAARTRIITIFSGAAGEGGSPSTSSTPSTDTNPAISLVRPVDGMASYRPPIRATVHSVRASQRCGRHEGTATPTVHTNLTDGDDVDGTDANFPAPWARKRAYITCA
jgi:hypothetical protein